MRRPLYTVDGDADAVEAFFDPSEYELDSVQVTALSDTRAKEWSAKFDLAREFAMTGGTLTVQAGAKGHWPAQSYDLETRYWAKGRPTRAGLACHHNIRTHTKTAGPGTTER